MEFYQLQSAIAIANTKNFTKAAELVNVSQSALSQQIAKLESELGIQLFDRSGKAITLLPAGEEFIKCAERIVNDYELTVRVMDAYKHNKMGSIRIGGFPIISCYHLVEVITGFMAQYPDIKTSYEEAEDMELLENLKTGAIDACFLSSMDFEGQKLKHYDLMYDSIVAVLDESHPLANRTSLALKELKNEQFILSSDISNHYYDVVNACVKEGFELNLAFSCRDVATMFSFIKQKAGITLLSRCVAEDRAGEGLVIIPVKPMITRKVVLAARDNYEINPAINTFVDYVRRITLPNSIPGDLRSGMT